MILGSEDGSIVPVGLDEPTKIEGEDATTMLGSTVKEVALSVPVGLMLCGAGLVETTIADVSIPLVEETTETAEAEAAVAVETEADSLTPDSVTVPEETARPVGDAVADSLRKLVTASRSPVPDDIVMLVEAVAETLPTRVMEVWTPLLDDTSEVAERPIVAAVPEIFSAPVVEV